MSTEIGYAKGEECNRDGCDGIIDAHSKDGSCYCHVSPPCSYCTDASEYCPVCDWDGREEQVAKEKAHYDKYVASGQAERDRKQQLERNAKEKEFNDLFHSKAIVKEPDYRRYGHSNSSMRIVGMYPPGIDFEAWRKEVGIIGTFGGRFEMHNKETGRFIYIAYTD